MSAAGRHGGTPPPAGSPHRCRRAGWRHRRPMPAGPYGPPRGRRRRSSQSANWNVRRSVSGPQYSSKTSPWRLYSGHTSSEGTPCSARCERSAQVMRPGVTPRRYRRRTARAPGRPRSEAASSPRTARMAGGARAERFGYAAAGSAGGVSVSRPAIAPPEDGASCRSTPRAAASAGSRGGCRR